MAKIMDGKALSVKIREQIKKEAAVPLLFV